MSKKLLYLLGILLTIIVGTILHRSLSCNCGVKSGDKEIAKAGKSVVAIPDEKAAAMPQPVSDSAKVKNWQSVREKLNANPLILYYEINQSETSLKQEEKQKLEEIVDYFKNVPDAGLEITGHADNTGSRDDNIRLGQERADRVKAALVQNGIAGNLITCTSRGPDEPVADNSTPEGRAKNRRTVTLIK